MSPRLQALLGYEIVSPFMGHVTASHPTKVLRPGYVNAVAEGRAAPHEPRAGDISQIDEDS